jgi:hypothetical protein
VVNAGDEFGRPEPLCVDPSPASGTRGGSRGATAGGNPLQGLGLPLNMLDQILNGNPRNGVQLRGQNRGAANDLLRFLFG